MLQEDDVEVTDQKDCDDVIIGNTLLGRIIVDGYRDLEDFARVQILIGQDYIDRDVTFTLSIDHIAEGSPSINIFEAIDGSDNYLLDATIAHSQAQKKKIATIDSSETPLDMQYLRGGMIRFVFEGCTTGVGYVTLTAGSQGTIIAQKRVLLDLRHAEEMYEKYKVTRTVGGTEEVGTYAGSIEGNYTYTPESDDYLLFVHGWNLHEWNKDRWAATVFKRLWWQGYTGHCGLFIWPTEIQDGSITLGHKSRNYDRSEQKAWESADLLKRWIATLNSRHPGKVRIIAHSMGNVVTSEALLRSEKHTVHTFISTQAAISAHCFDERVPIHHFEWYRDGPSTPDIYGRYFSGDHRSRPYMNDGNGITNSMSNGMYHLFNVEDDALGWWDVNNQLKPDAGYDYKSPDKTFSEYVQGRDAFYSSREFYLDQPRRRGDWQLLLPQHRFHIFSYIAESRSRALGAVSMNLNGFKGAVDLQTQFGFNETHYSHSRQFRSNIVREWGYWELVIDKAMLPKTR